jgi:hypothetical protein
VVNVEAADMDYDPPAGWGMPWGPSWGSYRAGRGRGGGHGGGHGHHGRGRR